VIYFDAAYIAKCYLNEPDAAKVRAVAMGAPGLACCELGRAEFFSLIHRQYREAKASLQEMQAVFADFEEDERNGVWRWLPVSSPLIRRVCDSIRNLPQNQFLRAADAVHLECARLHGFAEVYTNDRHMLSAAPHFGLRGVCVT
jgi:predicted nucleic acid-binding protein